MTTQPTAAPAPVEPVPARPEPADVPSGDMHTSPEPEGHDAGTHEEVAWAPQPAAWAPQEQPSPLAQLGRDTAYLLATLPLAILSFTVAVSGLSLAAGLLVTVLGIPVAVGTLAATQGLGRLERRRLALRGTVLEPIVYAPPRGTGLRAMFSRLTDPRRWATALHALLALPMSVLTWSVAVTWWAGALAGLTYWFWANLIPRQEDNIGLAELLHLPLSESLLNAIIGLGFAATLMPVLRWCVGLHELAAKALLTGASRRALAAQVQDLTERRAAAAAAETHSLRRLERDIHDGPQQRLVRLAMDLSVAERRLDDDPEAARELLAAARAQAAETLAELRALSRGIAPPVLADRGLAAAITAVAARATLPTSVEVELPSADRPSPAVENAAYFMVCEALANTMKHAQASAAWVRIRPAGPGAGARLVIEVQDDGVGGAALGKGHGLAGLAGRIEGLGGVLTVHSPQGGPTTVTANLPWS